MSEIRESFKRDLAEVSWKELRVHLQRDALILVAADLELIEAAVAVADDDKDRVTEWIGASRIGKPTADQLRLWESEPEQSFRMLIVQPFILIQDIVHA